MQGGGVNKMCIGPLILCQNPEAVRWLGAAHRSARLGVVHDAGWAWLGRASDVAWGCVAGQGLAVVDSMQQQLCTQLIPAAF